jgi:uncharacterized protein YgbK (DUF1537 family)
MLPGFRTKSQPRRVPHNASGLPERNDVVSIEPSGASTLVMFDADSFEDTEAEVCAICTETRDIPAEQAVETLHRIAQRPELELYDQVFKKIDSVFRGNTFREVQAAVDAFPTRFAVIAPAYPALGRISADGMLNVRDIAGETSIPVRERLHATGLRPRWIAAGQSAQEIERQMLQSLREGVRVAFCDAVTEQDLHATVQAARALQTNILWIGSAGLAHALAADIPSRTLRAEGSAGGVLLIFAGSDHPVTQSQMAALHQQHSVLTWPAVCTDNAPTAVLFHIYRGETTEDEIRTAVSSFSPQTVSCLFMTGGDTAMLVCRALGIHSLCLHDEFEPGLPQGTAVGGSFAGCNVILKSGGFGQIDVLSRIATHFCQKKEDIQ